MTTSRPPLPPFDESAALTKVQAGEDAWNTRDPQRVAAAYTLDSRWRNRSTFLTGREQIVAFLTDKWAREHDYALRKSLLRHPDRGALPVRVARRRRPVVA
jgi:nuclear transport factor 2 (NTF2) superfamily protein